MAAQIEATEQYFDVVLLVMLYKVALTFQSVNQTLLCVTIQLKTVTG